MNKSGIQFAPFIVGTMRLGQWGAGFDTKAYQSFIEACLELGLNDFDHADIYGDYTTEKEFGAVLKSSPSLREQMQITSKFGIKMVSPNRPFHSIKSYDTSSQHIINSVNNSLRQLNTEYLDVLLIHRPDILMDYHEIAESFHALKTRGKVHHFGVSNFECWQFDALNQLIPLCTNQVEASILHLDAYTNGTLAQCQSLGINPTIWSPFAGGKIFADKDNPSVKRIHLVLEKLMKKYSAQADQILLAWIRKHPSDSIPVLGTSKIERIQSAKVSLDININREEWYELYCASTGKKVP
jgi:predicted oxidoreductase